MPTERYVVLGLAGVRAAWFAEVARWATAATIPVDFVKVVSREEARARLLSGRPFSAMVVDAGLGALDRDLVDVAVGHGCAVVAADDGRAARSWRDLGVHAVLPVGFGPDDLLDVLGSASAAAHGGGGGGARRGVGGPHERDLPSRAAWMMGAPSAWSGSARVTVKLAAVAERPAGLGHGHDPQAGGGHGGLVLGGVHVDRVAGTQAAVDGQVAAERDRHLRGRLAAHLIAHGPELEQLPVADRRHEHPALELGRRLERGPRHPGGKVHRHEADRVGAHGLAGGRARSATA